VAQLQMARKQIISLISSLICLAIQLQKRLSFYRTVLIGLALYMRPGVFYLD
jgi:hypothetical protein